MFQNRRFSALASRSSFGAAMCVAAVTLCVILFALCNSVSADRSGMAASRFLAAAGACGIPLPCGAQRRKSYCSGCMMVANGAFAKCFLARTILSVQASLCGSLLCAKACVLWSWHVCSKPVRYSAGKRAAVLLALMLACLNKCHVCWKPA